MGDGNTFGAPRRIDARLDLRRAILLDSRSDAALVDSRSHSTFLDTWSRLAADLGSPVHLRTRRHSLALCRRSVRLRANGGQTKRPRFYGTSRPWFGWSRFSPHRALRHAVLCPHAIGRQTPPDFRVLSDVAAIDIVEPYKVLTKAPVSQRLRDRHGKRPVRGARSRTGTSQPLFIAPRTGRPQAAVSFEPGIPLS